MQSTLFRRRTYESTRENPKDPRADPHRRDPGVWQQKLRCLLHQQHLRDRPDLQGSGLLNILVKNNRVSGYLIDTNLNKRFPVTGYVRGDNVTIDTDCTEPGSALNCRKIFKGSLVSDYVVQGKAIGVGSGDFTIDKNKFTVITESPYIRDTGITLNLSVLQNGVQKYSSQNNMPLNAGTANKSYLELKTNDFIGKDMLYFKEAYLKLNVLGLNIKNKAEIVLFKRVVDKSGNVSMQRIARLKTVTKDDTNEISLDISSQIRQPNEQGYFIGLIGDEKDYIIFNGNTIRTDLSYYGDASSYKPRKVLNKRASALPPLLSALQNSSRTYKL